MGEWVSGGALPGTGGLPPGGGAGGRLYGVPAASARVAAFGAIYDVGLAPVAAAHDRDAQLVGGRHYIGAPQLGQLLTSASWYCPHLGQVAGSGLGSGPVRAVVAVVVSFIGVSPPCVG